MSDDVKVVFASASDDINPTLIDIVAGLHPELDLYVVSEFPPHRGRWIQYHVQRSFRENLAKVRAGLRGHRVRLSALVLQPRMPFWRMRAIAVALAPLRTLFFNENLDHFMLRPRALPKLFRHAAWRLKNLYKWETQPGGGLYTFAWRVRHPHAFRRPWLYRRALLEGRSIAARKAARRATAPVEMAGVKNGISVVIPSRNGRELLQTLLPGLTRELEEWTAEILVVDNGSSDGTHEFLRREYPQVRVIESAEPLSFARAVNRGIDAAQYGRTLLLNNDMEIHPGFFAALAEAFDRVPDLFCATAQIFFPEGQRREETGKAFLRYRGPKDFPAYCAEPIEGENLSYVLYGSGGCSLYSTAKLRALGRVGEVFEPAYVEDLDLGYRAWQRGWPTVFAEDAKVTHRHRATTSRYFTQEELDRVLEVNYLRFLARSVADPAVFRMLWKQAIDRLNVRAVDGIASGDAALEAAGTAGEWVECVASPAFDERLILALGSGDVAVFPGRKSRGRPVVLIATPYLPFPLSHGGAVRMFNLMRRAAGEFDQVVVSFCDELATPPAELLDFCSEIVLVRRVGAHEHPSTERPDVVEEFSSDAFRGALRQTVRKWNAVVAQLEFTQLAQYARDCAPAKTILVEHDVTLDLYAQLLAQSEDWEMRRQLERWTTFERRAWREVDCVVTMSEKDRALVQGAKEVVELPNGVDLERFRPSERDPEPRRLLFIGSFAHLPNLIAVAWFLREVWPLLRDIEPQLHIIAGSRHEYFLDLYRSRVEVDLSGIEVQDFVADVRPAYERATVVIAPLQASAGTNIKIMEAMAMEKAIVSTSGGVNGLNVTPGVDFLLANSSAEFAAAIRRMIDDPDARRRIELQARRTAEAKYDWDRIAEQQSRLYNQSSNGDRASSGTGGERER